MAIIGTLGLHRNILTKTRKNGDNNHPRNFTLIGLRTAT
jgi:hypothetical protein